MSWALWGLLAAALAVRLPGIARPLLGPFATKNVVYAMIARNWSLGRAPAWLPTLDCLVGGERSLHLVEFPVSAYLSGSLWRAFGGGLDVWGRATAIGFSVTAIGLLFLLVRRSHSQSAALAAAAVLAFSPVSIIYGQSFMLEASLVCFALATLWSAQCWADGRRWRWLALAAIFFALMLLTKVYMIVLLLPLAVIVWRRDEQSSRHTPCVVTSDSTRCVPATITAGLLAILPAAGWYLYVLAAPGQPLADHVFYSARQSADAHALPIPLLASAEFYRQVFSDLCGVALTPVGFGLALIGLANRQWRRHLAWLSSMALLVFLLPRKFAEMNYYYLVILPPLCVLAGLGWERLLGAPWFPRWGAVALVFVAVLCSAGLTIGPAFITPLSDRAVFAAGRTIQQFAPVDEPVIAMHGSSPDLLYYCDRPGWALAPGKPDLAARIEDCRRQGARWLVLVDKPGGNAAVCEPALSRAATVHRGDGFRIYRLDRSPMQAGNP